MKTLTTHWPLGLLLACCVLAGCSDSNDDFQPQEPGPPPAATASARVVSGEGDLLSGPLARGVVGDLVMENELLRVIIQQPGRNWFGIGTYGGNIIDVGRLQPDGSYTPDHMEEFVTGVNIENTPNFTEVTVVNDGSDGAPAQVCASGPDDLLDFVNASSVIRGLGFAYPDSADDRDLPLEIETCYSLAADESWVTMDTRLLNTSAEALPIYWVEYLNGSGEVEAFQPQLGFGEPLLTPGCPLETEVACTAGLCDQCNYLAYSGHDGATGVSYGLIHEVPGSTSLSTSGVNVLVLGETVLRLVTGAAGPNFEVPADGELSLRRYFAVGDGSASSIADIRNQINGIETGSLNGVVSSAGEPVADASVAIFITENDLLDPPILFMAGHTRTDADGAYSLTLPPGDYQVQANAEGYEFASDEPAVAVINTGVATSLDFDLPQPGFLEVSVTGKPLVGVAGPVPAKLQVVGFDPSPPLYNRVLASLTGVFGDGSDTLPYGISAVEFIDRSGQSSRLTLEPGDYQVVVSLGPRYSAFKQDISITPGQTTTVQAELAQVLSTPGYVYGDFHVHSIDSPDAEVTRAERVATYLAEGMDFFTPSDHGIRVDFSDTLSSMDVQDLIGSAVSGEITPFDYGHINSWPVTVDSSKIGGGSIDWGREAAPGEDFPEYASYVLSPAEIFTAALADPLANITQINHIASHFGADGLAIDTGLVPPQSQVDVTQRRMDPNLGNAFDAGFQALEVWIGTNGRAGIEEEFLGQNAGDWFNLINQGIVRTGVADSDTHSRRTTYLATRNQIASSVTDPGLLSDQAETLAATVAAGKNIGTNAPFVTLVASGSFGGNTQTAGLGIDDTLEMDLDSGGEVTVTVNIQSADWAAVDAVDFYINNQPERSSAPGAVARYGVCADITVTASDPNWSETIVVVDPAIAGASRREVSVELSLPGVTEDSWLVAIIHGSDGVSPPLFPIVPEDIQQSSNTTLAELTDSNLGEDGVLAYAFTNPVFIDVDGDGWTPPGVANASCSP
ncbi:MAG: carboxypeptidase regulatory-like domain-containing protein [Halieaceae bacterium]